MTRFFLVALALLAPVFIAASSVQARIEVLPHPSAPPVPRNRPPVTSAQPLYVPPGVVVPPFILKKGGEVWIYQDHHFYPAFPKGFVHDYHGRAYPHPHRR